LVDTGKLSRDLLHLNDGRGALGVVALPVQLHPAADHLELELFVDDAGVLEAVADDEGERLQVEEVAKGVGDCLLISLDEVAHWDSNMAEGGLLEDGVSKMI